MGKKKSEIKERYFQLSTGEKKELIMYRIRMISDLLINFPIDNKPLFISACKQIKHFIDFTEKWDISINNINAIKELYNKHFTYEQFIKYYINAGGLIDLCEEYEKEISLNNFFIPDEEILYFSKMNYGDINGGDYNEHNYIINGDEYDELMNYYIRRGDNYEKK